MISKRIFTITGIIGLLLISVSARLFDELVTSIVSALVIGTLIFMRVSKRKEKKK